MGSTFTKPKACEKNQRFLPMFNIKQKIPKKSLQSIYQSSVSSSSLLFVTTKVFFSPASKKNQPNGARHTLRKRLRIFKGPVVPLKDRPQATTPLGRLTAGTSRGIMEPSILILWGVLWKGYFFCTYILKKNVYISGCGGWTPPNLKNVIVKNGIFFPQGRVKKKNI